MKSAHVVKAAHCVKAIAHPLRLSMLSMLAEGEKNVQELTRALGTSQSNVSQHLFQMRARDLVVSRRAGNMVYYSIQNPKLVKLMELMKEIFCGEWFFLRFYISIP
jgi:DNA-binding transcriptional ArsR family regulator